MDIRIPKCLIASVLLITACSAGSTNVSDTESSTEITSQDGTVQNATNVNQDQNNNSAIASTVTGVSFDAPAGINATINEASGAVVFGDGTTFEGYALAVNEGGQIAVEILFRDRLLIPSSIQAELFSEPLVTNDTFQAAYIAQREDAEFMMQLIMIEGPATNAIAIVGLSSVENFDTTGAILQSVAGSVVFSSPAGSTPVVNLSNSFFELVDGQVSQSGSGSSLNGEKQAQLLTCADTRYAFATSDSTFITFTGQNGTSGSSTDSDQHAGVWQNIYDFTGTQNIYLQSSDRRGFMFAARVFDGSVFLNDDRYVQSSDDQQCAS